MMVASLGVAGWLGYEWFTGRGVVSDGMLALIPPDAVFCVATDDPVRVWRRLADSRSWHHLQGNEYFASLTASVNSVDSMMRRNQTLFDLLGSRAMAVSAHMTGLEQYDFLFVADLMQAAKVRFINQYISDVAASDYRVTREQYQGHDVLTLRKQDSNDNLYIAFLGNFVAVSYNRSILLHTVRTANTGDMESAYKFSSIGGDVLQVYVDYKELPKFISVFSNEGRDYALGLSTVLKVTQLNASFDDELLKARGRTTVLDSVQSYLHSLLVSGKGSTDFVDVAPQRTSFVAALGFESFGLFFENFEQNLRRDVNGYDDYKASLSQAENYLGIDMQEHFVRWLDDEIVLLQMQSPAGVEAPETALLLEARDVGRARESLEYMERMVRRKTPVKFKSVTYRGHAIHYLSMKNVFRLVLGKYFSRLDKPYYAIVDNFVIFSDHPQTLEGIIDDYLDEDTLADDVSFTAFRRQFENESTVFIYGNTDRLFETMQRVVEPEIWASMKKNRDYIVGFRHLGFQLVPDGDGFITTLAEQFETAPPDITVADSDTHADAVTVVSDPSTADPMELPPMYIHDLRASTHTEWYEDSTVRCIVGIKHGFKDGNFTAYYPNGTVKMKGQFRDGKREGVWRLFAEDGKIILRRTYQRDKIKRERGL